MEPLWFQNAIWMKAWGDVLMWVPLRALIVSLKNGQNFGLLKTLGRHGSVKAGTAIYYCAE
jgi:hypothetical protein